jgi:hypothetical protein
MAWCLVKAQGQLYFTFTSLGGGSFHRKACVVSFIIIPASEEMNWNVFIIENK